MPDPNNNRPLPFGARIGDIEVRMRPLPCPQCGKTLRAHDVERTDGGYRLICECGDVLLIERS